MPGYEDAPATKMLATNCACCGKELLDAESVTVGLGPECRRKHAVPPELTEDARLEANKLIHSIAMDQSGSSVDTALKRLSELGCAAIVKRIQNRVYGKRHVIVSVYVDPERKGTRFALASPWSDDFVYRVKRIRGRCWDGEKKVNHFPVSEWLAVWELVADCYRGKLLETPKGEHVINGSILRAEEIGLPESSKDEPVEPVKPVEVKIERHEKWFALYTPYDGKLVDELRTVYGRRWNSAIRANIFPAEMEDDVCEIVQRHFPSATFTTESK